MASVKRSEYLKNPIGGVANSVAIAVKTVIGVPIIAVPKYYARACGIRINIHVIAREGIGFEKISLTTAAERHPDPIERDLVILKPIARPRIPRRIIDEYSEAQ